MGQKYHSVSSSSNLQHALGDGGERTASMLGGCVLARKARCCLHPLNITCSLRQTAGLVFPRGGRRAEAGLGPRVVGRMLLSAAPAFLSRRVRVSTLFGRKCKVCPRAAFSDYSPASVLGLEPLQPGPGTGTWAGPPQHVCTPARPLRPATAPPGASRTPGRLHLRSATLQY